jgi:hypothetical protein
MQTPIGKSFKVPFLGGRLLYLPKDAGEAVLPGNLFFNGHLSAIHRDALGRIKDIYDLGSGVVTDEGVAYMVDDFDNASGGADISLFNFHDSGTGVAAAAVTDVDLGTPAGPATRATGTRSQPAANQFRSVGTIAYTGTLAITEWGLFTDSNRATNIMWDRRVFAAINVVSGDSIEFTYTLTVNAGG